MGFLSWLGLRQGAEYPNLDALLKALRRALPEHENVVLRYIAIVIVLLGKVAWADGSFTAQEEQALRDLLAHIDRISPSGVEAVCAALRGNMADVTEEEQALCFRELKALCDGRERVEVMRLLTELAAADGTPTQLERTELQAIATELGVPLSDVASFERDIRERGARKTNEAPAPKPGA